MAKKDGEEVKLEDSEKKNTIQPEKTKKQGKFKLLKDKD